MRSVGGVQIGKAGAPVSHICQAYPTGSKCGGVTSAAT